MNEYDDLFKKIDDNQIFVETNNTQKNSSLDPQAEIEDVMARSRINRTILIVYIVVSILTTLISSGYFLLQYPNADSIRENITGEPVISAFVGEDSAYPYGIAINGVMTNTNAVVLPVLWVTVDLYDQSENLIETLYFDAKNVPESGTLIIDYEGEYNIEVFSYIIESGFDESSMFYILLNLSTVFICSLIFLFIDKSGFGKDWKALKKAPSHFVGKMFLGYAMVYIVLTFSNLILALLGVEGTSQNENTIAGMFSSDPFALILLFLLLCVFTPIVEELVFRKVLYGFFEKRFGVVIAIIISGLIFGFMHVLSYGDFIQAIPYVLMGAAFGFVYHWANKNIFVTMGVHFLNNFLSFMYYLLLVFGISIL